MSAVLANGVQVIAASMSVPLNGPWVIDCTTSVPLELGGPALISDGGRVWFGTTRASGGLAGIYHSRIVGGRGKLTTDVAPRHWRGFTVGGALAATLTDGGEVISPLIPGNVLSRPLAYWTRQFGPLQTAIADLADEASVQWRVLSDGMVWLGTGRPTPSSPLDEKPIVLDAQLDVDLLALSVETFSVIPGDEIAGMKVQSVRYELGSTLRAWAYMERT
jgi:hypothetical protein